MFLLDRFRADSCSSRSMLLSPMLEDLPVTRGSLALKTGSARMARVFGAIVRPLVCFLRMAMVEAEGRLIISWLTING